ncbi:trifunctional UDP-glucose 4,6-dehydratase/UDP-4-keto-6-deoxy-D-glucose 3,5-epimerase/UDP-4-keto-L-rhamnose-reductase RHM1-like protein [Tanacetum coccineum]
MSTYTPNNILITGAAEFIAIHVANRLIGSYPDYKIVVIDKLEYCFILKNLNPSRSSSNFKFMSLTHLAKVFSSQRITFMLLMCFLERVRSLVRFRRFIHVSMDEVYRKTEDVAIVGNHEASQFLPTNLYSSTKAEYSSYKIWKYWRMDFVFILGMVVMLLIVA